MAGRQKADPRKLTAYHEAGHAVAAFDQGVRIHGISIAPDQVSRGHIGIDTLHLDRHVSSFREDRGSRNRFLMERHVLVLLAGKAAARRLDPSFRKRRADTPEEGSDYGTARCLIGYFAGSDREAEKYREWLETRVEGILSAPWRWHQVKKLAQALLEEEKMGAKRVREVIRDAGQDWYDGHLTGKE